MLDSRHHALKVSEALVEVQPGTVRDHVLDPGVQRGETQGLLHRHARASKVESQQILLGRTEVEEWSAWMSSTKVKQHKRQGDVGTARQCAEPRRTTQREARNAARGGVGGRCSGRRGRPETNTVVRAR